MAGSIWVSHAMLLSMDEDALPPIPYRRAWMAAAAAFLIHNVEETTLDLPGWSVAHPVLTWFGWMEQPGLFSIAVGIMSLAVGCGAIYAIATGPSWSGWVLHLFAFVMLLNALGHISISLMTSSLMPGVITAVLVILPVMAGVFWVTRDRARGLAQGRHKPPPGVDSRSVDRSTPTTEG